MNPRLVALTLPVAFLCALSGCGSLLGSFTGGEDRDVVDGPDGRDPAPPVVRDVSITPDDPFVDGEARCDADVTGDADLSFRWRNETRGRDVGSGRSIRLDPDEIRPGETLRCIATASNHDGEDEGHAEVAPRCGFERAASMQDVTVTLHIVFRPYITDELYAGYEGYPWDWDGNVPSWVFELRDALDSVLGFVNSVYPTAQGLSAADALVAIETVLDLYQEHGPGLFAASVPPDPDVFPYAADDEGSLYSVGFEEPFTWTDEYEIGVTLRHLDLSQLSVLAFDLEDGDAAYNDNMGDYLDQGGTPLAFSTRFLRDNAWCTSTYYNPDSTAGESEVAYIPSSILWLDIEVGS